MFDPQLQELEAEAQEILAECYKSTPMLCKTLFPDDFFTPFTELHYQIFDKIDNSPSKFICIAAPRGLGKSTICEALVKRAILYQDKRFIGYLSNSATSAELYTENIKMDLLSNEQVKTFGFAPLSASTGEIDEEVFKQMQFSRKSWVANGHSLVLPRGAGQQVRGLKWIRYRPDLWIIDDLEDDEEIMNEVQREKLRTWFYGSLMKTVSRYKQDFKMIYIDTVKHEDALIQHLLDDPKWDSIRLSAYETNDKGEYITTCPGYISQEELDQEVENARHNNTLDILARELGSQPIDKLSNEFYKFIQYYEETDLEFTERLSFLESFVICDPSRSVTMHSAPSGFLVFSVDVQKGAVYVRTAFEKKLHQDELINEIFDLCEMYKCGGFGVEITGLHEHITYPIRNAMLSNNRSNLDFIELKARSGAGVFAGVSGGKVGRARGLVPLYRQGLVKHNRHGTAPLEQAMLSFPRPKSWATLDCAAYIPQIMEMGLRYMHPQVEGEDKQWLAEQYASLKNEPPLRIKGI